MRAPGLAKPTAMSIGANASAACVEMEPDIKKSLRTWSHSSKTLLSFTEIGRRRSWSRACEARTIASNLLKSVGECSCA